jgi:hypothetical protein
VLQDLIDKELIIADSEESKLVVSNGDIRQEMETLFGPNIISNLDKVGLTFDEAWQMVRNDIIMRRMLFIKAHSKAMRQVTPEVIRKSYEAYAKENIRPDIWIYQVVSFRDQNGDRAEKAAIQAHQHLKDDRTALAALADRMGAMELSTQMTISDEFRHIDNEVSSAYREPLSKLQPGRFSQPIATKSRVDNSTVYRIFFLKEKILGGRIPFSEIGPQIKENLLNNAAMVETDNYLLKLRKHFDLQATHLDELKAEGFEPFQII